MLSNWNVNDYKTDFESEEHWELRRSFMLAHKDKLPEDEIVCLAQVFTNVELLGCRYPDETMRRVAELAKGVVEPFRERKKNCLKRTFVAASDAAVAKVKGQRSSSEVNQTNETNDTSQTDERNPIVQSSSTIQTNLTVQTMQLIQTNPPVQTIQTNPTVQTMELLQTNAAVPTIQTNETNPTVPTIQPIQTNPTVPTIQPIQTNPTVQTIQTNPTVQTDETNLTVQTDETNPTVQSMEPLQTNPAVPTVQQIQTNPTVQTMEPLQISPIIPTIQQIQTNPTVQTMEPMQTSSAVQTLQPMQTSPIIQKIRANSAIQTNPVTQKIRINSAVQTNQTIQKNQTHQAIQTVQTNKVDQMVQTTKVDQTVQTYLPNEATQTPKATHTTQGTQTIVPRTQNRVKNQNHAKQQKNLKRNIKKSLKRNKDKDTDSDIGDGAAADGGGGDGGVTILDDEFTDIKRCIWDDVEISGHTNSHSDQLNNKGNNCSDDKQSSAIEFLAASTNSSYTLDPTGVKKLNELKPRFVFFLYDEPPVNLLQRNATLNRGTLRWHFEGQKGHRACSVYYNGILLGSSDVCAKKQAKEKAAKEAIKNLRSLCYTVKIKKHVKCLNKVTPAALGCPDGEIKLKSAIGEQIMRLMGWSGGGLGVHQQGMIQPVSLLPNSGRDGLGLTRNLKQDPGFRKRADTFLKRWIQTDSEEDLVFSTEFTHAQREILHKVASDLNLKSRSYGKKDDRYIVIYKKPIPWRIVDKLVKMGGNTNRYELIIPTVTIP